MVRGNELAQGEVHFEGRDISFKDITVPVLSFGGASDTIAPVSCVRPVEDLVPNAAEMRFEVVPGGHLGMLTGRRARTTTWRIMDEFIEKHSSDAAEPAKARKKPATKKSGAKKAGATSGKKSGRKSVATAPVVRDDNGDPVIGANPARRFSSASSRSLSAKPRGRDAG
jgi:polyhydroxyalkanoate synthase